MDYRGCFGCLFAPVPLPVVWVVSAYCIILSRADAEMLAIHLSIFPVSAEVANQTNIIFQNATSGGKELNPVALSQKKTPTLMSADFNSTASDSTVCRIRVF